MEYAIGQVLQDGAGRVQPCSPEQGNAVLQIPVRASRHGPLADFFQQTGPVLVREAF